MSVCMYNYYVCMHACMHAWVWFGFRGPWGPLYDTQVYNASGWTMPSITNSVIRCAFLPGPETYIIWLQYIQKNIDIIILHRYIYARNRYPHHPYRNKIKRTWTGMSQNVGWGVGRALRFHTMSFCVLQQSPSHISSDNTRLALVWHKTLSCCRLLWPFTNHEQVSTRCFESDIVSIWLSLSVSCHGCLGSNSIYPRFQTGAGSNCRIVLPQRKSSLTSRHIPEWGSFLGILISRPIKIGALVHCEHQNKILKRLDRTYP